MAEFAAVVEMDGAAHLSEAQWEALIAAGVQYGAAWSARNGRLTVRFTVPGRDIRQGGDVAQLVAVGMTERAGISGYVVVSCTVETEDLFEERLREPVIPKLLSAEEVAAQLGISRQAVMKRTAQLGGIPVGERRWVFPATAIQAARR